MSGVPGVTSIIFLHLTQLDLSTHHPSLLSDHCYPFSVTASANYPIVLIEILLSLYVGGISKTAKILYCTSGHLMVLEQYFKHRQAPLALFGGNHPKHGMRRLECTLSTLEDRLTLFSRAIVKSSQAIKQSTRP